MQMLRHGDRGEEVRRLQHNLNIAIGSRYGFLPENGIFGPRTEQAVRHFQRDFRLRSTNGVVGPETRQAMATRVLIVSGSITRRIPAKPRSLSFNLPPLQLRTDLLGSGAATAAQPAPTNQPAPILTLAPQKSHWLVQAQPQFMLTPPPFAFYDPQRGPAPDYILSGAVSAGFIYRTASEGPHWEFGLAPQFLYNSRNVPSDPLYTMQLQASASYADPWSRGRFHSALFLQVVGILNFKPFTGGLQVAPGAQLSVDIIEDRWSLFLQGTLASQWNLSNGQWMLAPGVALGSTIQWEIPTGHR